MARQAWLSLGFRCGAGHGLWSVAAFLFPSLAIADGEDLSVAMGLFVLETTAAVAILSARLGVSWVVTRRDAAARDRLRRVAHGLNGVLLMGVVAGGYGLAVAVASMQVGEPGVTWESFLDRARWMLGALLATAALDSIIAPVRAPEWLETNLAWQASRSSVVVVSVLVGIPIALYQRSMEGFFWSFVAMRLLADLGAFKPGERERIRSLMFDGPVPAPGGLAVRWTRRGAGPLPR